MCQSLANHCTVAENLLNNSSKEKNDDATMNLGIGSLVKHKLVVFGLNNNDESCLC